MTIKESEHGRHGERKENKKEIETKETHDTQNRPQCRFAWQRPDDRTIWFLFGIRVNQKNTQLFTQKSDSQPNLKIGLDIALYLKVAGIRNEGEKVVPVFIMICHHNVSAE